MTARVGTRGTEGEHKGARPQPGRVARRTVQEPVRRGRGPGPTAVTSRWTARPHSTRLTGSRLTELLDQLAALRPGLKQPPSGALGSCAEQANRDGYLLRFTFPSGPPLDVCAHFDGRTRLGADNGARTGGLPPAFGDSFFGKADPGFGGVVAGDLREPAGPVRH